jgi:CubicO group peptidase (beta-lactamase class C family)
MTKLATAVALMQGVETGRLRLDDEVASILPEFGELQVLEGFEDGAPRLRAPARAATVRELMAHTSGLSYDVWNEDILRYDIELGVPGIASGLRATLLNPLAYDPGTRVEYGTGVDWAGLVVEAVAGRPLDEYFEAEIFAPLGMPDTGIARTEDQVRRTAPIVERRDDGSFHETTLGYPETLEFVTGGGCLYTTAGDWLRLQRALLRGGTLDGSTILQPASVDEMFAHQSGELQLEMLRSFVPILSRDADFGPGLHWGLGMTVNAESRPGGRNQGSGWWCGIFNTYFWIDRTAGITGALYLQTVPFYDPPAVAFYDAFEQGVYALAGA